MQVSIWWANETYSLVIIYGPTLPGHKHSYFCREQFHQFVNKAISFFNNIIMMGNYNNVVDPTIDTIRTFAVLNPHIEDVTTFTDMLANRTVVYTMSYLPLLDEFSGPMMMTNKSSRQVDATVRTTYKRLDSAYHHPSLADRIDACLKFQTH